MWELLFEKLREQNCDVEGALARFLDDEELYVQFYKELLNDNLFTELGLAINERRIGDAFDYAHTLKGVIGNMGITPMYETICDIVEPLRIGSTEGVSQKYDELLVQKIFFSQFID
jgi:hypothetical protein